MRVAFIGSLIVPTLGVVRRVTVVEPGRNHEIHGFVSEISSVTNKLGCHRDGLVQKNEHQCQSRDLMMLLFVMILYSLCQFSTALIC